MFVRVAPIVMAQLSVAGCFIAAINMLFSPPYDHLLWSILSVVVATLLVIAGFWNMFVIKYFWKGM